MFWGLLLEEGKFYSQKVTKPFHVSMAALEPSGKGGNPAVTVNLEQGGMDFILCTLKEETLYQQAVDLNFAEDDEIKFFLSGKGTVHLTGYVVSEQDSDDDPDYEDDSDEGPPQLTESVTKKPKENVSKKKAVEEAKEDSDDSEEESDDDSDEDSDEEEEPAPKSKKPAVPDKKAKVEKKPEKPVAAKKDEKAEDDSDEDDSDEDDSDEDGGIDFKKLMAEASSGDDDDDDDIDMDEMDEDEDDEGEDEEESEDESSEEEAPPPKKSKTPPVTPTTDSSKVKKDKKTPVSALKETKKEKVKATPEPVQSGKKRKEIDSPLVNGVEAHPKKSKKNKQDKEKAPEPSPVKTPKRSIKGGILVEDLKVGNGPESVTGKYVSVYYTGKLKSNSEQFDSNTSGKGFKFRLGGNEVIKGWDLGVAGMKVGGKRRLTIPYKMAYGEKGSAPEIPPKADLVFDVELKNVH